MSDLRNEILSLVDRFHGEQWPAREFVPGESRVPVSGKVFDGADLRNVVDAGLDFWLTAGRFADDFESRFAKTVGTRYSLLVNSGSSANLVAVSALTSPLLGDRRLRPGDEVITVAAGFPTTVNPIVQNGCVPVFVDVEPTTYNVNLDRLEAAITDRTRAIVIAHTLGNPFRVAEIAALCKQHDLWLVEDMCDALGAEYDGVPVGTFGHFATASFYPAHHITMGEGGAVMTKSPLLKKAAESFRDWGRDCWCAPGIDDTCGKRFEWQLGDLPHGYDHKYTYSHVGYNLKVSDMQAAVGVSQLDKLPGFVAARRANFNRLWKGLASLEEMLVLPEATPTSSPSWFGFPITVREDSPISANDLVRHLEDRKIATRKIFAGNLVRQPAYAEVDYRVEGPLDVTDDIMQNAFWIGVYPGLTAPMLDYVVETFQDAFAAPECVHRAA